MAANAHHDQRVLVAAARRPRRAALLGGDPAGGRARPDRPAGRRLRFRLWLGDRHRRGAARVRAARRWRSLSNPLGRADPGRAHRRLPAPSGRALRLQRQAATPIRTSAWSTGPAAIRSIITRTSTGCAAPGSGPRPSSCTSRGGPRPRATPTSCCRRPPRSSATTSAPRIATLTWSPCSRRSRRSARRAATTRSSRRWRSALGCEAAYTEGRDEMEWLRHLYGRWRDELRTNQAAIPDFDGFWSDGLPRDSRGAPTTTCMLGGIPRRSAEQAAATPSGRIELYSERIAGFGYDDCPPHATWLEPAEWLGARSADLSAASRVEPAALSAAQPDGLAAR